MRRVLIPGVALGFATMACAAATRPGAPGSARAKAEQAEVAVIVVGEQSNICVSVHVDPRLWSRPAEAAYFRNFSGHLMVELRRLYEMRGGSNNLPGTHNEARFVTYQGTTNPFCQDRENDVFVEMRYSLRQDGTPFAVTYRIARGAAIRTDGAEVDLAEELRTGRILGFSPRRTIRSVIGEDISQRARSIIRELSG